MKWVNLDGYHINTNHVTTFFWHDGGLVLYHTNGKNVKLNDPDRELYFKICRSQGICPVMEDDDG